MQSLPSVNQSLFVNKHTDRVDVKQHKTDDASKQSQSAKPIEGELIKIGDSVSYSQAQDIFMRSTAFNELPYQVQHGLNKYTEHEMSDKRESLKSLMGVDLYA